MLKSVHNKTMRARANIKNGRERRIYIVTMINTLVYGLGYNFDNEDKGKERRGRREGEEGKGLIIFKKKFF